MIDSSNFLSESCVSCFTKAPEKHHEALIENPIALLNVLLTATGTTTRSARSSTSTRPQHRAPRGQRRRPRSHPQIGKDLRKDNDEFNKLCLFKNSDKNLSEVSLRARSRCSAEGTCSKDLLVYEYNPSKEHGLFNKLCIIRHHQQLASLQLNEPPPPENIETLHHTKRTSID